MARNLGRPDEEIERVVLFDRTRRTGHQTELEVDQRRRLDRTGIAYDVPAAQRVQRDARDVDRYTCSRQRTLGPGAVRLQPAHPSRQPARMKLDLVADRQRSIQQRPGNDCAETADGKRTVHRQPRDAASDRS